jgi:bifunctional DNase/RNase
MNKNVIEVRLRAVLPLEGSFAVFLGTEEKTFVIYVDETVGTAISMFMRGVSKERPLTHDLIGHLLLAFGAKVDRVVINHFDAGVFHARLILSAENELHNRKLIEIDARPSDSIALATQAGAPILVAHAVWEAVEDVSHTLAKIEEQGAFQIADPEHSEPFEGDDDEDDDDEEGDDLEAELFPGDDDYFADEDDDEDDDDDGEDFDLEDDEDDDDDDDDEPGAEPKSDNPFDFGFSDDDDEGEEWKKG